ncbi:MAG: oligosaccharide flippase family protein [Longimicrobiales bacterium]
MTAAAPAPPSAEGTRQVLANGVALLLAYVLPRVFTLGSVVLAARILGPEAFGVYGTAAAFAVVFSILATLGMQPLLVREIARAPERAGALVRAAHVVKTGTNLVMLAAVGLAGPALLGTDGPARRAALVLAVGYALGAYAENLGAYYQAVERMGRWTQASAIFGLVSGGVGAALLLATGSVVMFCWGPAVGWAAALAWLRVRAPDGVGQPGSVRGGDVRSLLRGLAPFAAAFIGITVYSKIDVLLLARVHGDAAVGVYAAAYKFVDLFQALVIVAAAAVYPRLSRTAVSGGPSAQWRGGRSTEVVLLAAVPAGIGLHLLAAPLTAVLFGAAYGASVPALRLLALLLPLLAVSIHGGYVLGAAGRMRAVAALYGVGLVTNVALNLVAIPAFGPPGAAASRLASETVLMVGFLAVLRGAGAGARGRVLALAGAAAGLGMVVSLLPDPSGGWLRASIAAVAWAVLYVRAGAWTPGEAEAVRSGLAGWRTAG